MISLALPSSNEKSVTVPSGARSWRAVLATLGGAGYRAVAPDQRGYSPGVRPEGLGAYVIEELVADVGRFADALGRDRFHLVGHDWGGFVAWYTADRLAPRVRTLSAVSTPHPLAFAAAFLKMFWRMSTEKRITVAAVVADTCVVFASTFPAASRARTTK